MKYLLLLMSKFASTTALCRPVTCYEDPVTNAQQCIDTTQVYEKNGVRSTALYVGGPNSISKTDFTVHVNCSTQVTHLKDRRGVSFAGGDGNKTVAIRNIRAWACQATPQILKTKNTKQ